MRRYFIYLSHKQDIFFFHRFVVNAPNILGDQNFDFEIYCCSEIERDFVQHLETYQIDIKFLPFSLGYRRNIVRFFWALIRAKIYISRNRFGDAILLCRDKSKLISRLLIASSRYVILFQQVEKFENYKKDLFKNIFFNFFNLVSYCNICTYYRSDESGGNIYGLVPHFEGKSRILRLVEGDDGVGGGFRFGDLQPHRNVGLLKPRRAEPCSDDVIFLSSRFFGWNYRFDCWSDRRKVELAVGSLLQEIADKVGDRKVFYFPHPYERDGEFEFFEEYFSNVCFVDGYLCAEHFLLSCSTTNVCCVGLGSTALVMAVRMGFPSFCFYRRLGFEGSVLEAYDNIFSDFPREGFLHETTELKPYSVNNDPFFCEAKIADFLRGGDD